MEKRTGWGAEYPPEKGNGEWEYQAFTADKAVNDTEDLNRGFSCHKTKEQQDFVFTVDQMKCGRLDLRRRSAEGYVSGVSQCESLGTTGWGKPGGPGGWPTPGRRWPAPCFRHAPQGLCTSPCG